MVVVLEVFKSWCKVDVEICCVVLMKVVDVIEENVEEFGLLLMVEQGKLLQQVMGEVGMFVFWLCGVVLQMVEDQIIEDSDEWFSCLWCVLLGVVVGIVLWNFFVFMVIQKFGLVLLIGNMFVFKLLLFILLMMLCFVEFIVDVFLVGVFNVIIGGDQFGLLMIFYFVVVKVSFIGFMVIGKKVMELVVYDFKCIMLEFGGNDVLIVMFDVDVFFVVQQFFWLSFINVGQICIVVKCVYIYEDIYDEMVVVFKVIVEQVKVGDGIDLEIGVGLFQNLCQYWCVEGFVVDVKECGFDFFIGGDGGFDEFGYYLLIILFDNLFEDVCIVSEEQFGFVLLLMKFKMIEEVVVKVNDIDYGFVGVVWFVDEDVVFEIVEQFEMGMVWINEFFYFLFFVLFGGYKYLGFGVEFGKEGFEVYIYLQVIMIK